MMIGTQRPKSGGNEAVKAAAKAIERTWPRNRW
jgi:hypothetical protein